MIDMRTGKFRFVRARDQVLMATGGGPTMYKYHTPSGDKTMDGLAMALRAGLPLRDMEMVQFHPTGLLAGDHTKNDRHGAGRRGCAGRAGNCSMAPSAASCSIMTTAANAPPATWSRAASYAEMQKSNTTTNGGVYIKMSHLGPEMVRQKFSGMVKRCADSGFDLAGGLVEVVPTAHYFMGGVVVDTDTRTEMEGLYVAGEDAGGAHGSNRLGGNGVANSTVYGGVAGDVMASDIRKMGALRDPDESVLDAEIARACQPLGHKPANIQDLRHRLQEAMWEDVGVIRTRRGMQRGINRVAEISDELMVSGVASSNLAFNLTWHDWLNLRSLCDVSDVIAEAALARENSRGAHYREDFPDTGDLDSSYFTVARQRDGEIDVSREPVQFSIVRPGETILPAGEPETLVEAS